MARGATTALRRGWTTGSCAEAAQATLSDKNVVEVAIVDHQGDILARVGV
jgi:cobalamin biosynthesis protein CbiD